jgi:histidine triad (HIT) family protein
MLIPRRHVQDIWGVDEELAGVFGADTVRLANAIRRAVEPEGMTIIQSNGRAASQSVMHLHIHIVPRWENDSVERIWPAESSFTEGQKDSVWDEIRVECRVFDARWSGAQ